MLKYLNYYKLFIKYGNIYTQFVYIFDVNNKYELIN